MSDEVTDEEVAAFGQLMNQEESDKDFQKELARCPIDFENSHANLKLIAHGFYMAGQRRVLESIDRIADEQD